MSQSVTSPTVGTSRNAVPRRPWPAWTLAALELLVGVSAVFGGWNLIADGYGLPVEWLSRTPFDTWTWPGIALIVGVAVPQFAAAAVAVAGRRPELGYRLSLAVGVILVLWIVVQLALLQQYFFLQPIIAGFGLVEIGLALWWRRLAAHED